jgi:large subunit ribosomal protein L6
MSRIGRLPVPVPGGVDVSIADQLVTVKGPKGTLAHRVSEPTTGYEKTLEIVGTGYRVTAKGSDLEFALGFSHPVVITPPAGVSFEVQAPTRFVVKGIDKQLVGETAAKIRKLRKPDPYKGKGVRYQGEVVRRKAGKTGK